MDRRIENRSRREIERELCYAHIRFEMTPNLAYVRDVTSRGVKFVFLDSVSLASQEMLAAEIMPIPESGIPWFGVNLDIKWSRYESGLFICGALFVNLLPDSQAKILQLVSIFEHPEGPGIRIL